MMNDAKKLPALYLSALNERDAARNERDAARAEVERLRGEVGEANALMWDFASRLEVDLYDGESIQDNSVFIASAIDANKAEVERLRNLYDISLERIASLERSASRDEEIMRFRTQLDRSNQLVKEWQNVLVEFAAVVLEEDDG